mgnify:CR=1 FL=1
METALSVQEQDVVVQPGRVSPLAVPTASWLQVVAPYELRVFENGRALGTTGRAPVGRAWPGWRDPDVMGDNHVMDDNPSLVRPVRLELTLSGT